jgi:hypothetical protein
MSAKQKYCSLYTFIKKNNKELFSLLDDLCAESLFKQKWPLTFLNPNKDIVKKLEKLIDNGNPEEALQKLKSLFIYGKHDSLSKDLISYNRKKLTDSAELSKLKKSGSYNQWEGRDNNSVFEYTFSDFPKEGSEVEKPPIGKGEHNKDDVRVKYTHELMESYVRSENLKPVIYKLNSLLKYIKSKEPNTFDKIKLLVDPSPILSWYILVQPTKTTNKHISDDLFNEWENTVGEHTLSETTELVSIFTSNEYDNKKLKDISIKRKSIKPVGFDNTIDEIHKAYNNDYLKLAEDELRFRFGDEKKLTEEHIVELNLVDWDTPKNSLILLNRLPKTNILRSEVMHILTLFLKTNAFLYTPYNKEVIDKLKNTIKGAGSSESSFHFIGSNGMDDLEKMSNELNLDSLVSSLNPNQLKDLHGKTKAKLIALNEFIE